MTQSNGNGKSENAQTENIEVYRKIENDPGEIPEAIWTKETIKGDGIELVLEEDIPELTEEEDSDN